MFDDSTGVGATDSNGLRLNCVMRMGRLHTVAQLVLLRGQAAQSGMV